MTCNTFCRVLNDGHLVVIIGVDPAVNDGTMPYRVRRVDGQPFASSIDLESGERRFMTDFVTWAPASKLRKVDPDAADPEPVEVTLELGAA